MSKRVYQEVLAHVFKALQDHHVYLEGLLLETNFVRAGHTHCKQSTVLENAKATLEVLQRCVPPAVPGTSKQICGYCMHVSSKYYQQCIILINLVVGVLFLSGHLSEDDATLNLNMINKIKGKKPWTLTFSFGRAMHNSVLQAWKGSKENVPTAHCELMRLARVGSLC